MKYQLYAWQEECLKFWADNHYHGIINVVTGGGKTILALSAIRLLENDLQKMHTAFNKPSSQPALRIKIVVPTASLLTQWSAAILDFFGSAVSRDEIGYYYGGHKDLPDRKFMLYVINSARYTLARHILNDISSGCTVFLIADECHHYTGAENRKIFDFLPYIKHCSKQYASLGLSATPDAGGLGYESVLVPSLGAEIYRYSFSDAAKKQTLCRSAVFQIALFFTPEENYEYQDLSERLSITMNILIARQPFLKGLNSSSFFRIIRQLADGNSPSAPLAQAFLTLSYQRKFLTTCAKARISCALSLIRLMDEKTKILIFGERIDQADALYEALERILPNQAARYHSAMDKQARKLVLERYRDGEIRILVSCRALDEGFDVPAANAGIILSSAGVERQRIQRLGRILRRFEGKEIASLYYLYISDSAEQTSLFQEMPVGTAVCNLSYSEEEDRFYHPAYETAAETVLHQFEQKNPDDHLLSEAKKCLCQGIVRPDWLLGTKRCSEKITSARTTSERNYWLCMKQMAITAPSEEDIGER